MLETTLADRPAKTASPRKSPDARNLRRQVSLWGGGGLPSPEGVQSPCSGVAQLSTPCGWPVAHFDASALT